jgi:hypothetical protein
VQSYGTPIAGPPVDAVGERQRLERRQQQAWEWVGYIEQKRDNRRRTFEELGAADEAALQRHLRIVRRGDDGVDGTEDAA